MSRVEKAKTVVTDAIKQKPKSLAQRYKSFLNKAWKSSSGLPLIIVTAAAIPVIAKYYDVNISDLIENPENLSTDVALKWGLTTLSFLAAYRCVHVGTQHVRAGVTKLFGAKAGFLKKAQSAGKYMTPSYWSTLLVQKLFIGSIANAVSVAGAGVITYKALDYLNL